MYGRTYMGTARVTFVIDEKGILKEVIGKVDTKNHAAQILKNGDNKKVEVAAKVSPVKKVSKTSPKKDVKKVAKTTKKSVKKKK
jgi:thioredoxin-dependent peroxiredoxin